MLELHILSQRTRDLMGAFAIGDSEDVLIGRDADCDVQIASPSVSRTHCLIEQADGIRSLRDLESFGGTLQNGAPIDSIRIEHGTEVQVGPAILKFIDE